MVCEVCFDQWGINFVWLLYCFGDGGFGDGVKGYVGYMCVFFNCMVFGQCFLQVLVDGFVFVIRVGCEDQFVIGFECVCNCFDVCVVVV